MVAQTAEPTTVEPRGASVIVNVIDVLRCFTAEQPVLGVTEIATRVGLHKSSISRILATLELERIVQRDAETRKYSLGLGLIAVSGPLLANLDVRRVSFPFLEELALETGETAVLTIWDGLESISVEQIPSIHQVKHTSAMGSRYNTALSASVQVFLAHEEEKRVVDMLESGAVVLPRNTAAARAAYLKRLRTVRKRGYAANHGESSSEEVGVAAPIFDHRGTVVACALVAAPYYRVSTEKLGDLGAACVRAARHVGTRLGASPA
ncbi:IclR family transcriptional regulator [Paeniglutamicibacter psychrophenolicus]|uniref:IclR family transcriptional regulator n=1 Tax=Paeniglutamicibacter psychrophenolicus TaxID=257454 RepID=UPI0027810FDA|nr:IclR family transcriptional regulator [Paeniglutamicibacter psychrophenolicus]MDQ0095033.1 DNA-binding IclR family transcriptional regulator [Paeniglutamicibacter psychrophenolicus]